MFDLKQNNNYIIIMVWVTILTIWAVGSVTEALNQTQSVNVSGIPLQPVSRQFSTVQIDQNTVWVIDSESSWIKIITHDEDGYHMTQSEMSIEEK
ncbi:hypothetical protein [Paenibacillus tengchongensis]|uniref:hypothetical protein n=1 Tax=Paenibacillus tengchongensis TaxID=2608684 RepID=UPI00124E4040|nr:hypothetical protein [Paenibacillus tengchongensis]